MHRDALSHSERVLTLPLFSKGVFEHDLEERCHEDMLQTTTNDLQPHTGVSSEVWHLSKQQGVVAQTCDPTM